MHMSLVTFEFVVFSYISSAPILTAQATGFSTLLSPTFTLNKLEIPSFELLSVSQLMKPNTDLAKRLAFKLTVIGVLRIVVCN